ncbi:MAG TPA: hypothetical protein VMY38_01210 [Gemmatimonadaceae bacterium]|nr:hypothetical protein [Gemmatimonadaceae bacterium]
MLSLDTGLAAHKLSVVPHSCLRFVGVAVVAGLCGCGERAPEPAPPAPEPNATVATRSVAELTGWPAGLGRALVLRLAAPKDALRLVVPELGDGRFADSALSVRVGDSLSVSLIGHRGKVGDARVRVTDAEVGTGSCVTWPSVEMAVAGAARRSAAVWRVAMESDSLTPIAVDSLAGMSSLDSAALTNAIHSVLRDVPALTDSTLRGLPFSILRAYSLRAGGRSIVVAELSRKTSSEADPREQRLFVIGERNADEQAHSMVYSQDATGPADVAPVTDLLAAVVARASGRPILVVGVEGRSGMRLQLIQRVGRRQWRRSWTSVVNFC